MKKIPTMFKRDEAAKGRPVIPEIKPECQWVLDGEGVATRKLDGTNVKVLNGELWKRQKPKEGEYDEASYVKADRADPSDKWIFECFDQHLNLDGIYEAIGPKIQGNPETQELHILVSVIPPSAGIILTDAPRDFKGLCGYFMDNNFEGIVFHHPDGRMAKIKGRDFGIKRG